MKTYRFYYRVTTIDATDVKADTLEEAKKKFLEGETGELLQEEVESTDQPHLIEIAGGDGPLWITVYDKESEEA